MTTYSWVGVTGDWGATGDWSPGGAPSATDADVVFDQGTSAFTTTIDAGQTYQLDTLTLNVPGALLEVAGTLDFSGADNIISIGAGTLQLGAAGTLAGTPSVTLGATGTLDLNSTTQTIGGLSGSGSVLLEQGDLRLGAGGASGAFAGTIQAGANGEIEKIGTGGQTLAGVSMAGGAIYVEAGSLVVESGVNDIAYLAVGEGTGNTGTFDLSGGTLAISMDLQVGDYGGNGTFDQTGGAAVVSGSLNIGNQGGTGTYDLNGGTLSLENGLYDIGRNTGTHAASQGTLAITAGLLDIVSDNLIIGNVETGATGGEGSGLITQSGGTLRVEAGSGLFLSGAGNGEYDLDGGTLEVGGTGLSANFNNIGGSDIFDLGGGAIVVTGSALTTGVSATLVAGTSSTIDTNALGASFSGSITGSGTLVVTGGGTASFADLDTTGEIDLQAGTLASAARMASVGSLVVDGGGPATLSIAAGDTLQLTIANALTVTNGSSLDIIGGGTLLVAANAGALYAGKGGTGTSSSSGSITLEGSTSLIFSPTGYTDLIVGHGEQTIGTTGTFTQTGSSTVMLGSNAIIGVDGGVGTYDLSGNATLTTGAVENFLYIGLDQATGVFNATTSGALNISGNAVFDFTSGYLYVAAYADGSDTAGPAGAGTITQSDSAVVTLGGQYIDIGTGSGNQGVYNLQGGTLTVDDVHGMQLGEYAGSDGALNQTGGTLIDQTGIEIGVSGTGSYDLSGGTLVAGGAGGVSGTGTLVLAGGVIEADGGQLNVSTSVTLQADTISTLDLNGLGASFTGSVTGSGTLDIIGSGTATFTGLDTAGDVELASNTLDIAAGSTASVGGISGTGTLQVAGTLDVAAGDTVAVAGLSGAGAIQLNGTLDVSNVTGPTSIGALSGSGDVLLGAGTLTEGGSGASTNFSGTLLGGGTFIKAGSGTLVLGGADNTGALEVNDGTLQLGTGGTLSATTNVTLGVAGTLDLNSSTQIIGALSGSGVVQLEQGALIAGSDDSSSSFSGTINAGTKGYVAQIGTGTLTLNGATMDSGAFYVGSGTLAETAGNTSILYLAIGEGSGATGADMLSGGTLTIGSNFLLGDFGGSGTFTQTGGLLAVTGSFNIGNEGGSGTYNLNGGTVTLAGGIYDIGYNAGTNAAGAGTLNISGGLLDVTTTHMVIGDRVTATDGESSGLIMQTGGTLLIEAGTGLFLSGYGDGTYDLDGGTLQVGGADLSGHYAGGGSYVFDLGGGTIQVIGSTLVTSVSATLVAGTSSTIDTNDLGATWSGALSGSGGLIKVGLGTLALSGNDSLYTGAVTIDDGTLQLAAANALSASSDVTVAAGGTLDVHSTTQAIGSLAGSGAVLLGTGTLTAGGDGASTSFSGTLSGGGTFIKAGAGTLVLAGADNTGSVAIDDGTLQLGAAGTLAGAPAVTIGAGGTLDLNGTTQTISALSGSGALLLEQGDLTLGAGNASSSFAGTIEAGSNGEIVKIGTGALTLAGASMTGGAIYVEAGSLVVASGVNAVTYLAIGEGTGNQATGTLTGGTLTIANSFQIGDFGGTGSFVQTGGVLVADYSLNIGNQGGTGIYDLQGGTLVLGGSGSNLYDTGHNSSSHAASSGTLEISGGLLDQSLGVMVIGDLLPAPGVEGSGTILQTGGTYWVEAGSQLSLAGFGHGEYDLNGGTLEIGGASLQPYFANGSTTYAFDLGGGTIQAVGSALVTSVNATLTAGTSSTIDTNDLGATWSGALSGSGGLIKAGLGTLALSGNDSLYTGAVTIDDGTLQLAAADALSMSSDVTVAAGGTLDVDSTTQAIGSLAGAGAVLLGTGTLTAGGDGANTNFSGTLSGDTFIKAGTGTLVLAGDDATSTLVVSGGTLQLGATGTLSAATDVTVDAGSTLDLNSTSQTIGSLAGSGEVLLGAGALTAGADGASTVFSGTLHGGGSDTGVFTQTGTGTLTLDNAVMDAGEFHVADGTVIETTGGSSIYYAAIGEGTGNTGTFDLSGGTLAIDNALQIGDFGGTGTFTQSGGLLAITGSLNIGNQGGDGTFNLNGGTVTLSGGIYDIGRNTGTNAAGSGTLNISGGLLDVTTTHMVVGNRDSTATDGESSGLILQTGGTLLIEAGTGLFLSAYGDGTYDLDGGTLQVGGADLSGHYAGSGSYVFDLGGGTIQVIGSTLVTSVSATLVAGTSSTIDTNDLGATWSGALSGSGGLIKVGLGTLALSGNDSLYTGAVTIDDGTLQLAAANALSASSDVTVAAGGTLDVHSTTQAIGSLAGSGAVLLGTGTLTAGGDGASTSFSGTLSGGGSFIKAGIGTLVLAGADNTGSVAIDDGTLQLGAAGTLSTTTNVTVAAAGTLDINNTTLAVGSLAGSGVVALEQGELGVGADNASSSFSGIIQAGTGGALAKIGTGTLTLDGATMGGGSFYVMNGALAETAGSNSIADLAVGEGTGSTASDLLSGGTLTISNALQIGDFGGTGTFTQSGGLLAITGSLNIGNQGGDGTYVLNGGTVTLTNGLDDIGRNAGTNVAGQGTLTISGGLVDVISGELVLGNAYATTADSQSSGLITQTGGTLLVAAEAGLFLSANGNGEYDLDGGTLQIGGTSLGHSFTDGDASAVFDFGGGTIQVIGSALNSNVNVTLVAGTASTLELGTLGATLTSTMSGAGTLVVAGSSTASLEHLNATGVLDQQGGTVDITQSGSIGQVRVDAEASAQLAVSAGQSLAIGSAITIGAGATWTLSGTATVGAGGTISNDGTLTLSGATLTDTGALVNNGAIVLDPSTMTVGSLTGSGTVTLEAAGTLSMTGSVASGETILFDGSGASLVLGSPSNVAGSISNFAFGDSIRLDGVAPGSVTYSDGEVQIDGHDAFALALAGGNTLQIGAAGDNTELTALCFCHDTMIATPDGQVRVQDLMVGDLVATLGGAARPIRWIGVGAVLATRGRRTAATPVIVRKGALADNVPSQDLRVTKGHALYLDDALIPVEFLVNHRSIEWDDRAQEVSLYHVELPTHDVLIANGAPAESYRDDGNRWLFRNANNGWDLPAQAPCAPVLTGGKVVDAAWRRLLDRAGPRPGLPLTDDPDLHLLVDGRRVDAVSRRGDVHSFRVTAGAGVVRIASRAAAPQELGVARDPRVLGVAVRRIEARQGPRLRMIEAEDATLADGFHGFEPDNFWRWTDGDALVPAALFEGWQGGWDLEMCIGCAAEYGADALVGAAA